MRMTLAFPLGLALLLGVAGSAAAQTQPEPFPWQRKTDRLLNPKIVDPLAHARAILDRGISAPRLPANRKSRSTANPARARPSLATTAYGRFDTDRDGFISRAEYLAGGTRPGRAGAAGLARQASRRARLDSRFRVADRNRDGKLSASELQGLRNRRF